MLPQHHFAISGITIAAITYAAYPEKTALEITEWALYGGVLSAAMDLDIVVLVLLRSDRYETMKRFRNIVNIFKDFGGFKDAMAETGMLKTGMVSHLLLSVFLIVFFYYFGRNYFIPVVLGIVTHLITDLPNYRRLLRKD